MPTVSLAQAIEVAALHVREGRLDQGEALCHKILDKYPDEHRMLQLLGLIAYQRNQPQAALELIERAIALGPNVPDYHNNRGTVLLRIDRFYEAGEEFKRVLELLPDNPEALFNSGEASIALGDFSGAASYLRRYVQVRRDEPRGHSRLAHALWNLAQYSVCIDEYRIAVRLDPNFVEAWNNLGVALHKIQQFDEAIDCYQTVLRLQPTGTRAGHSLAIILRDRGRLDEAIELMRKAVLEFPDDPILHSDLLFVMQYRAKATPAEFRAEHAAFDRRHVQPLAREIAPQINRGDPQRRLRVGYVSPHFFWHSVCLFMLPLLKAHNRDQVEVHCYSCVTNPDDMTERIKSAADCWHDVANLDDEKLVRRIQADEIDILVDLVMHMGGNRALVFARKPAPVQVAWLAYPGTTGISTMDYRLTDPHLDPPQRSDSYYSEKTVYLPETFWCYHPISDIPDACRPPALDGQPFTFGSLNSFAKVNDQTIDLWSQVLRAVPESRLLLLCAVGKQRLRFLAAMKMRGVDPARIEFVQRLNRNDYLRTHSRIDVVLDPIPYNGHTTTMDALWMGVPVITLPGESAVSRGGLSILTNVGLPELIARSPEHYVQLAKEFAGDLSRLEDLRSMLRLRITASPVMDAPRFARNMEAAYRAMWREWCG